MCVYVSYDVGTLKMEQEANIQPTSSETFSAAVDYTHDICDICSLGVIISTRFFFSLLPISKPCPSANQILIVCEGREEDIEKEGREEDIEKEEVKKRKKLMMKHHHPKERTFPNHHFCPLYKDGYLWRTISNHHFCSLYKDGYLWSKIFFSPVTYSPLV